MRRGLTLVELMMTIMLVSILLLVTVFLLRAVLLSWSSQETRSGIDISLGRGMEEVARDLREARQAQASGDEIRFTRDLANYSVYYLYNSADSYPPSFGQPTYRLHKAALSGGMSGTFTYGAGDIKITDILPPPVSDLSLSGNLITLDLSVLRKDDTIRSKTKVRPRNL
jgi:prepilin-type N-terminal cleavage/methylation domain-containing protein